MLLNTLNKWSWNFTVNNGLDLLNNSWVDGLLNDSLVGDHAGVVGADLLVGVSLNNVDGRSINLTVNNGLYFYDLLWARGLLHDCGVDVSLNNSWCNVMETLASGLVVQTLVVSNELVVVVEHGGSCGQGNCRVLETPHLLSVLLGLGVVSSLLPLCCVFARTFEDCGWL